jgi:hypothetical protein
VRVKFSAKVHLFILFTIKKCEKVGIDRQPPVMQGFYGGSAKGRLLRCKRWPFTVQKMAFWKAKGHQLQKNL